MNRVANYTIKGFLYQFNVTLQNILDARDDAVITVEGLIEDIDIETDGTVSAVQCKYHEAQEAFALSSVYEPVLQMLVHFAKHAEKPIAYVLWAHFPSEAEGERQVTIPEVEKIIRTKDKNLRKYTCQIEETLDIALFLTRFKLVFGPSFDNTVADVHKKLETNGIEREQIEVLAYPNALTMIGDLSIQKDKAKRQITKAALLARLNTIKTLAISRWITALKSYQTLLKEKRKQLKHQLDANTRIRHIYLSHNLETFAEEVVVFIRDFLQKFHFKLCHIHTPLFCLDCDRESFDDIRRRLAAKSIRFNDGMLVEEFNKDHFLREPMRLVKANMREFDVRITTLQIAPDVLQETRCDDLYIVAPQDDKCFELLDVNVERLSVRNFMELRYILAMESTYE